MDIQVPIVATRFATDGSVTIDAKMKHAAVMPRSWVQRNASQDTRTAIVPCNTATSADGSCLVTTILMPSRIRLHPKPRHSRPHRRAAPPGTGLAGDVCTLVFRPPMIRSRYNNFADLVQFFVDWNSSAPTPCHSEAERSGGRRNLLFSRPCPNFPFVYRELQTPSTRSRDPSTQLSPPAPHHPRPPASPP
jgi:hypothetical protein